jgi:hypothetical protein
VKSGAVVSPKFGLYAIPAVSIFRNADRGDMPVAAAAIALGYRIQRDRSLNVGINLSRKASRVDPDLRIF